MCFGPTPTPPVALAQIHVDGCLREFEYATRDLPVAAAKVFATLNSNFNLVYVSRKPCGTT